MKTCKLIQRGKTYRHKSRGTTAVLIGGTEGLGVCMRHSNGSRVTGWQAFLKGWELTKEKL